MKRRRSSEGDCIHEALVTIGLPTHNGARRIRKAIDSVLAQSYPNWELVISDNASSDDTLTVCAAYAATDLRVRCLRQSTNIGMAANFNATLAGARGKYFAWLSDDDFWSPDYLECLVNCLRRDEDAAIAVCRYCYVYENGDIAPSCELDDTGSAFEHVIYYMKHGEINWFYGLYLTRVLTMCGGLHTDCRPFLHLSDYLTVLKVMLRGSVQVVNKVLVYKSARDLHRYRFERLRRREFDWPFCRAVARYLTMPIGLCLDFVWSVPLIMGSKYSWRAKARLMGESMRVWMRGHVILLSDICKGCRCLVQGLR